MPDVPNYSFDREDEPVKSKDVMKLELEKHKISEVEQTKREAMRCDGYWFNRGVVRVGIFIVLIVVALVAGSVFDNIHKEEMYRMGKENPEFFKDNHDKFSIDK